MWGNRSTNAKLLSASWAFLWNTFIRFWVSLNLRGHTALCHLSAGSHGHNTTSDVKRVFSSHFITEQIKVLQLSLRWGKKSGQFFLSSLVHSAELMGRYKIIMKGHYFFLSIGGIALKTKNSRIMLGCLISRAELQMPAHALEEACKKR